MDLHLTSESKTIGAKTITGQGTTLGLAQQHDGVGDVMAKNPFYQVRGHLRRQA